MGPDDVIRMLGEACAEGAPWAIEDPLQVLDHYTTFRSGLRKCTICAMPVVRCLGCEHLNSYSVSSQQCTKCGKSFKE